MHIILFPIRYAGREIKLAELIMNGWERGKLFIVGERKLRVLTNRCLYVHVKFSSVLRTASLQTEHGY